MTPSPHPATPTLSDLSPEARGLLETQTIELPSWAFGNSGTRFRVFTTAGVPRDPFEKIDDVARVNAFTGITPRVSLHIPWDRTDDYEALRAHAEERGVTIGTINSNVFQDEDYKLGSLCNPDERIRAKANGLLIDGLILIGFLIIATLVGTVFAPKTRGKSLEEIEMERYGEHVTSA